MTTTDIISLFEKTPSNVGLIDLDIHPAIPSDDQLRLAVILSTLGFNVTIRQGENFSTMIKGERV